MIVRRLDNLEPDREVSGATWKSRRLLLRDDGMGFSLHDTIIHAGTTTRMHYTNHLEAVYCIAGTGTVRAHATGETFAIAPGTVYALDAHDEHTLTADSELRLVCVFNPPLAGPETHDDGGSYPVVE